MNKEDLNKFAQPVVDMYNRVEAEMLINIGKRLNGKADLLEQDAEAFQLQMLENLHLLDKENLEIIRKYAGLKKNDLNRLLYQAGLEGLAEGEEALKKAVQEGADITPPAPLAQSVSLLEVMGYYADQAANVLNMTNSTLIAQAQQVYKDVINDAVFKALAGNVSGEFAIRQAINKWSTIGIPALIDKAGRRWSPEAYTRMVMVTSTNNTVNEAQDQRFEEWGVDHIEVTSHIGARPKCAPYQGKVFRINNKGSKKFPHIKSTSIGQPDGLFGINCGHFKHPYIPGVSTKTYEPYPKKKNADVYKESQKQRELERGIRKAKTRQRMLEASGDKEGAKKAKELVGKRQAQMRDFIDKTGRTRRRNREQIFGKNPEPIPATPAPPKPTPKPTPTPEPIPTPEPGPSEVIFDPSKYSADPETGDLQADEAFLNKLEDYERASVHGYTTNAYEEINEYLRTGEGQEPQSLGMLQNVFIEKRMANVGLTQNTVFKRNAIPLAFKSIFGDEAAKLGNNAMKSKLKNVSDEDNEDLKELKNALINGVMQDKAFLSTTYNQDLGGFSSNFGVEFELYIPKGFNRGMFVESVSEFEHEKEYLIDAGTEFKVVDVDVKKEGRMTNILVKVIPKE